MRLNWGTSCIRPDQALDGEEEVVWRVEEIVIGDGLWYLGTRKGVEDQFEG